MLHGLISSPSESFRSRKSPVGYSMVLLVLHASGDRSLLSPQGLRRLVYIRQSYLVPQPSRSERVAITCTGYGAHRRFRR